MRVTEVKSRACAFFCREGCAACSVSNLIEKTTENGRAASYDQAHAEPKRFEIRVWVFFWNPSSSARLPSRLARAPP